MKYGKLRIAWSVACGITAVLLTVVWLASYNWLVEVRGLFLSQAVELSSINGTVTFHTWEVGGSDTPAGIFITSSTDRSFYWALRRTIRPLGVFVLGRNLEVWASHWILALLAVALAIEPWITWSRRFSLRTLLIGMTLVAVVLGILAAT